MSVALLISIQPRLDELIEQGKKTIEVRKDFPHRVNVPFTCYIYKSMGRKRSVFARAIQKYFNCGKVVGEFICDRIDEYPYRSEFGYEISEEDFNATMLTADEFCGYGNQETLYGWHISELKIYDEPKALSEFRKPCTVEFNSFACRGCDYYNYYLPLFDGVADLSKSWCSDGSRVLKRPPQSWCYVEEG